MKPIQMTAYKCEYCNEHFTTEKEAIFHEDACSMKPKEDCKDMLHRYFHYTSSDYRLDVWTYPLKCLNDKTLQCLTVKTNGFGMDIKITKELPNRRWMELTKDEFENSIFDAVSECLKNTMAQWVDMEEEDE